VASAAPAAAALAATAGFAAGPASGADVAPVVVVADAAGGRGEAVTALDLALRRGVGWAPRAARGGGRGRGRPARL